MKNALSLKSEHLHYPPELPITDRREAIVRAIRENQVLVITGDTGSGKSTQIPKMCLEAGQGGRKIIGCTQPRRIAAITLSQRVAEEMGAEGSRLVGYKIRFQDRTERSTRIKFMTDGILLAEAQGDRRFRAYDTLIIDEAHERSLNIDFLLGLLRRLLPRRPDLKVIVTSATIDPERFSQAFGDAPIIEVTGRTYPVDVRYRPGDPQDDESTYVDQAVEAVDELKGRRRRGDVLVFMPTESDIRETVQRLEDKRYFNTLVFPLFGRLAAADQKRIFQPTTQDKIVVATNVAETSITIPRIKYVVDTGVARISQYNARTRTQSLPVAPISRASADQRKGRCGRVEAGICIRLYSEEDYESRPLYTPPEIQRSNLAEVILQMLFLKLGTIQNFPFIDPPSPAMIKDGFGVLQELSAVDERRKLTSLGRTMARLPLDPRLSRMLLQAKKEGALGEMAVLAAALSIQDPRERPMELEAQADQAHGQFKDPRSDFVTLLNLWEAFEGHRQKVQSQNQLRKYCKEHFLSFRRMREWRNVHEEIRSILEELGEWKPKLQEEHPPAPPQGGNAYASSPRRGNAHVSSPRRGNAHTSSPQGGNASGASSSVPPSRGVRGVSTEPASYEAVHRAVVSGYLSHIAVRKEKNIYQATKGRQVMLFPGSGLFNKGGAWIVSAEQVQTSRLFARVAANIQPEWLEELGKHLCRYNHFEPHWEKRRGQVVAFEQVKLYGLVIVDRRKVNFHRIRPAEAREIFIRSALVAGELPGNYGFLEHNQKLIQDIEDLESKTRRRDLLVDEEAIYHFYDERIPELSDVRSFNKFLKDQGGDDFLKMTEGDLLRSEPDLQELEQFPDVLELDDLRLPLRYRFEPGHEEDGVTVTIPAHALPKMEPAPFEWLVPGMLEEKVTELLKALPKGTRKHLVPVNQTARELVGRLPFRQGSLYAKLSSLIQEMKSIQVPLDQWNREALRDHLKMRFEVVDSQGKVLGAGRRLEDLQDIAPERQSDRVSEKARKTWETEEVDPWSLPELPQKIDLGTDSFGVTRYAYPALAPEDGRAALRLYEDPHEARAVTREGLLLLYRIVFAHPLKQFEKDWVFPKDMASMTFFMGSVQEANRRLQRHILLELFDLHDPQPPDRERFQAKVEELRGKLGLKGREILEEVLSVVREREKTRASLEHFRKMGASNPAVAKRMGHLLSELEALVPGDFLESYSRGRLRELPRYLEALRIRGERAYASPEKDRAKEESLSPHRERCEKLKQELSGETDPQALRFLEEFRWMLEEFKISVFAPEIKTRHPVSAKRLEKKWREHVPRGG